MSTLLLPGVFLHSELLSRRLTLPGIPRDEGGHGYPHTQTEADLHVPEFIRILAILCDSTDGRNGLKDPSTDASPFHDVNFSGQRPIVGVGCHFVVYASPFSKSGDEHVRATAMGAEVYCLKAPNLNNGPLSADYRREMNKVVLQEMRVLCHPTLAKHENIICLLGLDFQEDHDDFKIAWPVLLMEYADYATFDVFQEDVNIPDSTTRLLLLDIAVGLRELHRCNVIHGDLKSENVLICKHPTRQYIVKLSDFGFAVINPALDQDHQLPGCTWLWRAPESSYRLSVEGLKGTDIYSFGLTVWRTVVNCQNPFELYVPSHSTASMTINDDASVTRIKSDLAFLRLVRQSIDRSGSKILVGTSAEAVIQSTLHGDAAKRSLDDSIIEFSRDADYKNPE